MQCQVIAVSMYAQVDHERAGCKDNLSYQSLANVASKLVHVHHCPLFGKEKIRNAQRQRPRRPERASQYRRELQ